MNNELIHTLPDGPGVYFFKDATNAIMYIGKAISLRQRVKSYFRPDQDDWKTASLMRDCHTINYITTKNETEALLLEADLIKRYQPKYNVLLKDGQPFLYICFTDNDKRPEITLVRNKKLKGTYFGPFLHKAHARSAYHHIVTTFKLSLCNKRIVNGCLEYHLGICAGSCRSDFDLQAYQCRIELAKNALRKNRADFLKVAHEQMAFHSKNLEFERAQRLQRYIQDIESIFTVIQTRFFPDSFHHKIMVAAADTSLITLLQSNVAAQLQEFFKTKQPIGSIDCFDISHFQSHALVGSCIRFIDGKPDPNSFRRFKIRTLTQQNDYAALQEIVSRRYKSNDDYPDLILIDGGKGQLNAITPLITTTPIASLAKREERIFSQVYPDGICLNMHSDSGKLLIALRDYAHHFAINYHRLCRKKAMEKSS